jgi:competence protein ComEC
MVAFGQWSPTSPAGDIPPEKRLTVSVLDIGQGDSILIETPNDQTILIDGGPDQSVVQQLGVELPFFQHDIDMVILTHPHSDHVSGLVEVLRRYDVKEVLLTGALHTAPDYLAFLQEIKNQHIAVHAVTQPEVFDLGAGVRLELLYPLRDIQKQELKELNHSSIVARLVYGSREFMFTGDAEVEDEAAILASGQAVASDVLKVGHHGSTSSSSEEWLTAVDPDYAVISVGKDNSYGHPHKNILQRLLDHGIAIFRTDEEGTVHFVTDGESLLEY